MAPELGYRQIHGYHDPLPEFPLLTHISEAICTAAYRREEHSHPVLELCYVLAGHAERSVGGERYRVGPGDLFIIRPGEPHGARVDARDPYHFFAVGFDHRLLPLGTPAIPEAGPGADVSLAVEQADALEGDLRALERRVIPGGEGAERILRRILLELDRVDADGRQRRLTILQVQALLVELLVHVARCSLASREDATGVRGARVPVRAEFQRLLEWMRERLATPPSLAQMATRVGLSPAHFTVAFRREVGRTPIEHLTALRIDEAARRLAADPSAAITGIALDLGFSSSQYFSLLFRRAKGCTPGQWRARHSS
jgi:AraC-like DNA-binding protein